MLKEIQKKEIYFFLYIKQAVAYTLTLNDFVFSSRKKYYETKQDYPIQMRFINTNKIYYILRWFMSRFAACS